MRDRLGNARDRLGRLRGGGAGDDQDQSDDDQSDDTSEPEPEPEPDPPDPTDGSLADPTPEPAPGSRSSTDSSSPDNDTSTDPPDPSDGSLADPTPEPSPGSGSGSGSSGGSSGSGSSDGSSGSGAEERREDTPERERRDQQRSDGSSGGSSGSGSSDGSSGSGAEERRDDTPERERRDQQRSDDSGDTGTTTGGSSDVRGLDPFEQARDAARDLGITRDDAFGIQEQSDGSVEITVDGATATLSGDDVTGDDATVEGAFESTLRDELPVSFNDASGDGVPEPPESADDRLDEQDELEAVADQAGIGQDRDGSVRSTGDNTFVVDPDGAGNAEVITTGEADADALADAQLAVATDAEGVSEGDVTLADGEIVQSDAALVDSAAESSDRFGADDFAVTGSGDSREVALNESAVAELEDALRRDVAGESPVVSPTDVSVERDGDEFVAEVTSVSADDLPQDLRGQLIDTETTVERESLQTGATDVSGLFADPAGTTGVGGREGGDVRLAEESNDNIEGGDVSLAQSAAEQTEQSRQEQFGDVNLTGVAAPAVDSATEVANAVSETLTGSAVTSSDTPLADAADDGRDPLETGLDSATRTVADEIRTFADNVTEGVGTERDTPTATPTATGIGELGEDIAESTLDTGADAARAPSDALEAAELAAFVTEPTLSGDDERASERQDVVASTASDVIDQQVEQARQKPVETAVDAGTGLLIGSVGGVTAGRVLPSARRSRTTAGRGAVEQTADGISELPGDVGRRLRDQFSGESRAQLGPPDARGITGDNVRRERRESDTGSDSVETDADQLMLTREQERTVDEPSAEVTGDEFLSESELQGLRDEFGDGGGRIDTRADDGSAGRRGREQGAVRDRDGGGQFADAVAGAAGGGVGGAASVFDESDDAGGGGFAEIVGGDVGGSEADPAIGVTDGVERAGQRSEADSRTGAALDDVTRETEATRVLTDEVGELETGVTSVTSFARPDTQADTQARTPADSQIGPTSELKMDTRQQQERDSSEDQRRQRRRNRRNVPFGEMDNDNDQLEDFGDFGLDGDAEQEFEFEGFDGPLFEGDR